MDKRPYILIIGSTLEISNLAEQGGLRHDPSRGKLLGYLSLDTRCAEAAALGISCLGTAETLRDYIFRNPVDVVLLLSSLPPAASEELLEPILEIGLTLIVPIGVRVSLNSGLLEKTFIGHERFWDMEATTMTTVRRGRSYLLSKRSLDCLLAFGIMAVLSPLYLAIALAVKLSDPRQRSLARQYSARITYRYKGPK